MSKILTAALAAAITVAIFAAITAGAIVLGPETTATLMTLAIVALLVFAVAYVIISIARY